MYIYIYISIRSICILGAYVHACMHAYVSIYICVYVHTYIYIYVYVSRSACPWQSPKRLSHHSQEDKIASRNKEPDHVQ